MNRTANFGRASLFSFLSAFVLFIAGCAGFRGSVDQNTATDSTSPETQALASEQSDTTALVASDAATTATTTPQIVSTRSLLNKNDAGFGLDIAEGTGINQVAIQTDSANPTYQVSELKEPARIVIDMPGVKVNGSKAVPVADLELVSAIRVGGHPDKGRIVIDLPAGQQVNHQEEVRDGKIFVTLTTPGVNAAMAQAKLGTTEAASFQNTETVLEKEIAVDSTANEAVPSEIAQLNPADSTTTAKLPDTTASSAPGTSATVTDVKLNNKISGDTTVIAEVSAKSDYALKKTAPSEYVLTIRGASIAPDFASGALIAPAESKSIRSVRTVSEGNDVLLRIFAQPETVLDAKLEGKNVLVEASTLVEDIRAQLDPKSVTADAAKDKDSKDTVAKDPAPAPAVEAEKVPTPGSKVTVSNEPVAAPTGESDLSALLDDNSKYTGRLISLDLQDTDIDNALRIIAEVSNLNIVASDDVAGKVTLRLIDVPWDQALDVILKTNGLDKVIEGNVMRIAPVGKLREEREALKQAQQAEEELESLAVRYVRVSYAKANDVAAHVQKVLSERGAVFADEQSNQVIIKDTKKGIRNAIELIKKVDIRTPQVLLETQIVEAQRSLTRDLGAQLGFSIIASPETGNATGWNFPNSIAIGGGLAGGTASSFPAAATIVSGSNLSLAFGSADGTKSLDIALTQLEREGRVRIVSRPAVATTNNKPATIKSVEKVRIRMPDGGLSVATGSGANASGSSSSATETIEIGITLDVTPQASPDYYILLDIKAKSSTFGTRTVDGIPSEIERSANSTVLVSSGQTFALGGIYKLTDRDAVEGVPFLKDVPVIGHFFRRALLDNSDEELLFFLTPRIVEGSFDDAAMKVSS